MASKRIPRSLSTKLIFLKDDKKISDSLLKEQKEPKIIYHDISLTPLTNTGFNQEIINKWNEVRVGHLPKRRGLNSHFVYQDYLYIIGGKDITEGKLNDIDKINLKAPKPVWEKVTPKGIKLTLLSNHSGNEINGIYYIIGGESPDLRQMNSVFTYNIEQNKLECTNYKEEELVPIESHTADVYNDEIIIFGGYSKGDNLHTMYKFIPTTMKFELINSPSQNLPLPRSSHSSAIFNECLFIFGGSSKEGKLLNDLWKCNLITFEWTEFPIRKTDTVPNPRSGHKMCFYQDSIYLFGGKIGNFSETNDLWKLNPSTGAFTLLHDTMIEQYSQKELAEITLKDDAKSKDKKEFHLISKKEFEDRKNPFSKSYRGTKTKPLQPKMARSQSVIQMRNVYEKEIFTNSGFASMKGSAIYTLDDKGVFEAIDNLNGILPFKIGTNNELMISGHLPLPRDGHTMFVYDQMLVIFGGDRNKYPFNDLFMFKLD